MMRRKAKGYFKSIAAAVLIAASVSAAICGCSQNDESENLKFYTCDEYDLMCAYIKRYNLYCDENYDDTHKIEVVKFDSAEEMRTKLSTELMAGGGCDILSTSQGVPLEKLMLNGIAADIDGLEARYDYDIGISDCNSLVMSAGIMNGKRLALPISYTPNTFLTTEETLEKHGMSSSDFSLQKLQEVLEKSGGEYSLFGDTDYSEELFYYLLDGYVDFENKTVGFETEDFSRNLNTVYSLVSNDSAYESKRYDIWQSVIDGDCVFSEYGTLGFDMQILYYAWFSYYGATPTVVWQDDMPSVSVEYAIAVNNNCKNKEKLLPFLKYCLSERGQSRSYKSEDCIPVNNAAFNSAIDEAREGEYMDFDNSGSVDEKEIAIYKKARESALNDFKEAVNDAESCTLYRLTYPSESYYNSQVIGDVVEKYLSGDISRDKFISQLTSATQIYLDE